MTISELRSLCEATRVWLEKPYTPLPRDLARLVSAIQWSVTGQDAPFLSIMGSFGDSLVAAEGVLKVLDVADHVGGKCGHEEISGEARSLARRLYGLLEDVIPVMVGEACRQLVWPSWSPTQQQGDTGNETD